MESQTTAQALRPPDLLLRFHAGVPTLRWRTATPARGLECDARAGYPTHYPADPDLPYEARLPDNTLPDDTLPDDTLPDDTLADNTLSDAPAVDADETDFSTTADAARLFEVSGRRDLRVALL